MKLTVTKPTEIEADAIRVVVPVEYGEEDMPNDFPLREGDTWECTIDLATGRIADWPKYAGAQSIHMKVVDCGCYYLLDHGKQIAARDCEYVPEFFPGDHYGDYIIFDIGADGVIEGWSADAEDVAAEFLPAND